MLASLASLALVVLAASPCDDFAAEVARQTALMADDVATMPWVVEAGLRRLSWEAERCAQERERTTRETCAEREAAKQGGRP